MKEKDIINGEELEKINHELFGAFNPDDESWIVGGSKTVTSVMSWSPSGVSDAMIDYDWNFAELEG